MINRKYKKVREREDQKDMKIELKKERERVRNKKIDWEGSRKRMSLKTLGERSSFLMYAPGPAMASVRDVLPIGPSHDT